MTEKQRRIRRLIKRQDGKCFFCWEILEYETVQTPYRRGNEPTLEHLMGRHERVVIPLEERKKYHRAAHRACNHAMADLPMAVKLELRELCRQKGKDAFFSEAKRQRRICKPPEVLRQIEERKRVKGNRLRHTLSRSPPRFLLVSVYDGSP